jgi:hypothetical protein
VNGFTKCADIPGWLIKAELYDLGTKLGLAVWNGEEGAGKKRHAVRCDNLSDGIAALKIWVEVA